MYYWSSGDDVALGFCARGPIGVPDISNAIILLENNALPKQYHYATLNLLILKPNKSNVTEEYYIHIIIKLSKSMISICHTKSA